MHEARKDLKKLRSVLRLVRDRMDPDVYGREMERFREPGRMLAAARDAEVRLATIERLAGEAGMPDPGETRAYVEALERERDERAGGGGERDAAAERAAAEIEAGRAAIRDWSLPDRGWDLVGPGLRRGYRRGRRGLGAVRAQPSAENVHEWRKRVKDLWYHLRILVGLWPSVLGALADQAHRLSDLLGDHHDLAMLAEDARRRRELFASEDALAGLLAVAARRQGRLLDDALELGGRIYAERPKDFVRRFEAYWSAWRAS